MFIKSERPAKPKAYLLRIYCLELSICSEIKSVIYEKRIMHSNNEFNIHVTSNIHVCCVEISITEISKFGRNTLQ